MAAEGEGVQRQDTVLKQMLEAASKGDVSELTTLIDQGADVNATDSEGWSPLIFASKHGHLSAVQELLKRGAKPNPSAVAHTALRGASIFGQDMVIRALLAAQGDPNFPSFHGRTPLMGAAMNGHASTAALLLSAGSRFDAANDAGETALDLCNAKGNTEVAKAIVNGAARQALASGSWPEAKRRLQLSQCEEVINIEFEGKTLVDVAVESGNEEAAAELIAMGGTKGGVGNTGGEPYPTLAIPPPNPLSLTSTSSAPGDEDDDNNTTSQTRRVLVIGGTQFIGRLTVSALDQAGWEVAILTRGRSKNPHPDRVRHIACNRSAERERFKSIVQEEGPWDVIIDFVAFYKENVMDVALAVGTHPTHYMLISTDSVYMACDLPAQRPEQGISEEHSQRPQSEDDKEVLRRSDKYQYGYGSNKLECEECLFELKRRTGFRYTALRPCDVMGPYDNLGVFLRIQALVTKGHPVPVGVRASADESGRMSLVFARDVVTAILSAINAGDRVFGESLNLAGDQTPTMQELVELIAQAQGASEIKLDSAKPAMLPSVTFGPISSGKARRLLGWAPTPLQEWVKETVEWYQDGKNVAYTASYALMPASSP